ncbi:MAG: flagellar motor protein MotA [Verrucomicrobiae bacterium]|nr:flagellar motor protein MotA [Verrucomicrobiae bacterium]
MIKNADPVVQAIALILVLASVMTWAIVLEKLIRLRRLSADARTIEESAADGRLPASEQQTVGAAIAKAAVHELSEGASPGESRTDIRARLERAMRGALRSELRRYENGLPFLATVGSTTPFVGLLGTVWGIMHSFTAIATSKDTSLAVVAPGIAEALFVTALGLFAAIPAVIAYNQITTSLAKASERIAKPIGTMAKWLSRVDADKSGPSKAGPSNGRSARLGSVLQRRR